MSPMQNEYREESSMNTKREERERERERRNQLKFISVPIEACIVKESIVGQLSAAPSTYNML